MNRSNCGTTGDFKAIIMQEPRRAANLKLQRLQLSREGLTLHVAGERCQPKPLLLPVP